MIGKVRVDTVKLLLFWLLSHIVYVLISGHAATTVGTSVFIHFNINKNKSGIGFSATT